MKKEQIKNLKKGDFFKLKESDSSPVWIRGYYERSCKKYECYKFEDVNKEAFFKGEKEVFIDFEF